MVMGELRALCWFSLLVSQQNHSDLLFKALDDALKPFYQNNGNLQEQRITMSANANVHGLLAMESHELRKEKIYKMNTAMDALVYGAQKISTTKPW